MNPPGSNERAGRFFQRTKAVSGKKIGLERNGTHGRFLREHTKMQYDCWKKGMQKR